ncbi:MAG: putative heme transporter [Micromonosporaceae bacterium]|nr:putative heme transporter [Micromonosporaceae bacterium]
MDHSVLPRPAADARAPHGAEPPGPAPGPQSRSWRRTRLLFIGIAVVVAVVALRGRLPHPADVTAAIRAANPWWLVAGLVAEWVSMAMFARQQMWLLRGLGVSTTMGQALAVTYSRSAMSISMPAGSAVSAGFAYQTYRRWGASRETAGTVMILSGLASTVGLGLLYLLGFVALFATHPTDTWRAHPIGTALAALAVVVIAAVSGYGGHRHRRGSPAGHPTSVPGELVDPADTAGFPGAPPPAGRAGRRWLAFARATATTAKRMPRRYRRAALAFAVANWLTDLCCLAAVAKAFHLPLTFLQLATVYLAVQVVRQIPVTPGGIGVIEASLLAALVTAGAGQAPAAAAVLGYRLFSCWLVIPVGLLCWAMLRRAEPAKPIAARGEAERAVARGEAADS